MNSKTRQRSVKFSSDNKCHGIANLEYLETEGLKESLWYSQDEMRKLYRDSFEEARAIADCSQPEIIDDDKSYCSRGLEYMTVEDMALKRELALELVDIVLAEQGVQKLEGIEDPDYLAEACAMFSNERRHVAHLRALEDEKWVLDHLSVDLKASRKYSENRIDRFFTDLADMHLFAMPEPQPRKPRRHFYAKWEPASDTESTANESEETESDSDSAISA